MGMTTKPYLLLDAGGTLVFIDQDYLAHLADLQGFPVTGWRLHDEHFRLIHWYDTYVGNHRKLPPRLGKPYAQALFEAAGLPLEAAEKAGEMAEATHGERNLWTFTFPWVREALDGLRQAGYRMSIISNSDGRVAQQLSDVDLSHFFERVYDSAVVGSSKPDPHIFQLALSDLDLEPGDALYVGDMYYTDVWGANRAGMGAVHLDPLGLYGGWPGVHLEDVRQLVGWLPGYVAAQEAYDMRPLSRFTLRPGQRPG